MTNGKDPFVKHNGPVDSKKEKKSLFDDGEFACKMLNINFLFVFVYIFSELNRSNFVNAILFCCRSIF